MRKIYLWGYVKDETGKYKPMLSRRDPEKELSLKYKDWIIPAIGYPTPREALKRGREIVKRFNAIERGKHKR